VVSWPMPASSLWTRSELTVGHLRAAGSVDFPAAGMPQVTSTHGRAGLKVMFTRAR
jgi:hypothetical protein